MESTSEGGGQFLKQRQKYKLGQKFKEGEIGKGKVDSKTQEEELKKGEVGYKKSTDIQKKESRRGKLI